MCVQYGRGKKCLTDRWENGRNEKKRSRSKWEDKLVKINEIK